MDRCQGYRHANFRPIATSCLACRCSALDRRPDLRINTSGVGIEALREEASHRYANGSGDGDGSQKEEASAWIYWWRLSGVACRRIYGMKSLFHLCLVKCPQR